MASYKEIIAEIQEQIDEAQTQHDHKVAEASALEAELPQILEKIEQLQALKQQAVSISMVKPVTEKAAAPATSEEVSVPPTSDVDVSDLTALKAEYASQGISV